MRKAMTSILLAGLVAVGGAALAADPVTIGYLAAFRALGAQPTPMAWTEVQVVSGIDTVDFQKRLEPVFKQYGARFGDLIARIKSN